MGSARRRYVQIHSGVLSRLGLLDGSLVRLAPTLARGDAVEVYNDNEWVVKYVLNGQHLPPEAKPRARECAARRRRELLAAARGASVVGVLVRDAPAGGWYRQLDNAAHKRMRAWGSMRPRPEDVLRDPRPRRVRQIDPGGP